MRRAFACLIVIVIGGSRFAAQEPAPATGAVNVSGQSIFATYCVTCHGPGGRGDGPFAEVMRQRPADLTRIEARNGGTFPAEQVGRIIDGRQKVKGHGGGDMPVWGDAFARAAGPMDGDERIRRLVRYLESIQAAP